MKKSIDKKLKLKRETLRELTKAELRLVAGGGGQGSYRCGYPAGEERITDRAVTV
jgi:hypothetical protein